MAHRWIRLFPDYPDYQITLAKKLLASFLEYACLYDQVKKYNTIF